MLLKKNRQSLHEKMTSHLQNVTIPDAQFISEPWISGGLWSFEAPKDATSGSQMYLTY